LGKHFIYHNKQKIQIIFFFDILEKNNLKELNSKASFKMNQQNYFRKITKLK